MNCGPQSETMSSGSPKFRKTWMKRASAVSVAVGTPLMGINLHAFKKRSTTTRILVYPLEGGEGLWHNQCRDGTRVYLGWVRGSVSLLVGDEGFSPWHNRGIGGQIFGRLSTFLPPIFVSKHVLCRTNSWMPSTWC